MRTPLLPVILLSVLLAACAQGGLADAGVDATADAAKDTAVDAADVDPAREILADGTADSSPDGDATADVTIDSSLDDAVDAAADAAREVLPDAAADPSPDDGADVPADVGADVPVDPAAPDTVVPDAANDPGAGDTATDAILDAPTDAPPELPAHTAVFEQRSHPGCRPDGPYPVDRVVMYRDASALADLDVRAVAVSQGRTWLGTATGLYLAGTSDPAFLAISLPGGPAAVADLAPAGDGGVLAVQGAFLYTVDPEGTFAVVASGTEDLQRVFACGDDIYAVSAGSLLVADGGGLAAVEGPGAATVHDGTCADGALWVGADDGLWRRDGGTWSRAWMPEGGAAVTAVAAGGVFVAAAAGDAVAILDGESSVEVLAPGDNALPTGDVRALALSPDGNLLAVGHGIGVTRIDRATRVVEHYHSLRWLPAESVAALALDPDTLAIWAGTPGGASRLDKVDTTLADKADRMLAQLDRWFWRLTGFVAADANFVDPWSDTPLPLQDNDNDGQWTQEAVGAFCYAYRVTGEERYYEAARKAILNMALQIDIPAQDFVNAGLGRGFVTRSFVRDDEGEVFTSKATQSNWHLVHYSDGHDYYWKDDTSSDEIDGHFYGFSIYYDLCARDDAERAFVAEHLTALAGYILDHGFTLPDLDGQPTSHGLWNPETLAVAVDGLEECSLNGTPIEVCIDAWGGGAHLNSLEILGGMLAAWHVSGQQRFLDAYESLISEFRYDELATFNADVLTWTSPAIANYCDHELADLAFLTLLRYEPYAERRQLWADSMLAAWQYEIGERNPLKSLALASVLAEPPGLAAGVSTLVDYPEDLRQVRVDNSHRVDVALNGKDRFGTSQFAEVLPYDEIHVVRWDSNPYRVVDGHSGQSRRAPNFWMLPYWGLRYYGAICP